MALSVRNSPSCALYNWKKLSQNSFLSSSSPSLLLNRSSSSSSGSVNGFRNRNVVKACFFNPIEEPILKEALKSNGSISSVSPSVSLALGCFWPLQEPIAFAGGIFAGLLRLDLNEDPLKEWVARTAEAAGITAEEINAEASKTEEVVEQIEIE